MAHRQHIIILDFGSQYTQLIARRVRELKVYCEIVPFHADLNRLESPDVKGIILSGSPASVHDADAPEPAERLFDLNIPILGICYGCQLMGLRFGADVARSHHREYGPAQLDVTDDSSLFAGFDRFRPQAWMSHGDHLENLPGNFHVLAATDSIPCAAMGHDTRPLFGVQFHPEVIHTVQGSQIFQNFVHGICGCDPVWTPDIFVDSAVDAVRNQVGSGRVICGLSGGVDSAVVAMLLDKAIGNQLIAVFIDNGLLRAGEAENVVEVFKPRLDHRFIHIDAGERFLTRLKGITDPEQKRMIIGEEFIRVFEDEARSLGNIDFLAQGTLYPDVIESVSVKGPSATIKSHHNVGGLPEKMDLILVEPLRELFKDEVRHVGQALGLPEEIVWRQPFPGPGLAVRILGEITEDRVNILQQGDRIVRQEISAAGLMKELWQVFAVLLPVRTVGVMGDERTYEYVCAVRAVTSTDAMTADWARLPYDVLARISSRIANEVHGFNRVVYDISSKPPATIEWE